MSVTPTSNPIALTWTSPQVEFFSANRPWWMNILWFFVYSPTPQIVSSGFSSISMFSPVIRNTRRKFEFWSNLANSSDAFDLSRIIFWHDLHLCVFCMASFAIIVEFFFATEASVINVKWGWVKVWKWTTHSERILWCFPYWFGYSDHLVAYEDLQLAIYPYRLAIYDNTIASICLSIVEQIP